MFTLTASQPDWQKAVQEIALTTEAKARFILESVGPDVVAQLEALTEQKRGWISRSGELAGSYAFEVKPFRGGAMLILRVDADHAIYLEARDGFFVLNGVMDRGGPVETALREVCARIAPEFTVLVA
jgi:hypothetical protein